MHDKLLRRLRRQIAAVLILEHALLWLAGWAFVWGTAVIAWRVAAGAASDESWLGLAAVPVCVIVSAAIAIRGVPSRDRLRAVIDGASRCGGLLMAAAEMPLGNWQYLMPDPVRLKVNWRGGRAWSAFVAGVAFVVVALLFPQSLVSFAHEPPLDISQEAQQLAAQLDVLKQESVLDPQRADLLKERLQQLKDEASGASPVKTLEALDHVRDIVNKAAKQAAESAISKTEKLSQAEGLADGVRKTGGQLDPKVEKEAMATLAELVQQAAAESDEVNENRDPEMVKQLQAGKLNPDQLKKLAQALKSGKFDLSKMLDK